MYITYRHDMALAVKVALNPNATNNRPKQQILDSFKLKEFAENNLKFDEIGRKLSKTIENTVKIG